MCGRVPILIALLFLGISALGQQAGVPLWVFQMGGVGSGNLSNIEPKFHISPVDSTILITAAFYGTQAFRLGDTVISNMPLSSGENGMLLLKLDRHGSLQWVKAFKGGGANFFHDVAFDGQGDVYVGGQTGDPITVEGTVIDYGGSSGYILMKYTGGGVFQWLLHGANGNIQEMEWTEHGLLCAMVFEGHVEIGGSAFNSTPSAQSPAQDALLLRLSATGELTWSEQIGGQGNVEVRSLSCGGSMCAMLGRFDKEIIVEGAMHTTANEGSYRAFAMGFDTQDFSPSWFNMSSEPFVGLLTGIHVSYDSEVLLTGNFEGTMALSGQTLVSSGMRDILVYELSLESGQVIGATSYGAAGVEAGTHITENSGRVVLSGLYSSGSLSFNGVSLSNTNSAIQPFCVFLDREMKGQCALDLSADVDSRVFQSALVGDTLYSLLMVTTSTHVESTSLPAWGSFDLALVKTLIPCNRILDVGSIGNEGANEFFLLRNDPNPFSDYTDIVYRTRDCNQCQIIITDMSGRVVKRIQVRQNEGTVRLYSSEIGNGLFTYSIVENGRVVSTKRMVSSR